MICLIKDLIVTWSNLSPSGVFKIKSTEVSLLTVVMYATKSPVQMLTPVSMDARIKFTNLMKNILLTPVRVLLNTCQNGTAGSCFIKNQVYFARPETYQLKHF